MNSTLHEMSAFTMNRTGGNPAGVWIGPELPAPVEMLKIAARLGYSETAFVAGAPSSIRQVRYYSPADEVSFCGHATIAAAVVLGSSEGSGTYLFETAVGRVPVSVREADGQWTAALESVATHHRAPSPEALRTSLDLLNWDESELDESIPPAIAFAGAHHLVLTARTRERLGELRYPMDRMTSFMRTHNLTTLQLVWKESSDRFHARNPFAIGGVFEDPATGAAAAAFGGYLRDSGLRKPPLRFDVLQGEDMGRPSLLHVEIPASGGIVVSGAAHPIEASNHTSKR